MEIELTKKLLSEKQETIANLDQSLAKCELDLAEREKRINNAVQAEVKSQNILLMCGLCLSEY